jgi:hypothetical protein
VSVDVFRGYFKSVLRKSEVKQSLSQVVEDIAYRKSALDISSHLSSLGISLALASLGEYLATRHNKSPTARAVARIFGTITFPEEIRKISIFYFLQEKISYAALP